MGKVKGAMGKSKGAAKVKGGAKGAKGKSKGVAKARGEGR